MPQISIKNMKYEYQENEVINFAEGLIGLPQMRRAVLIPMAEYAPFCWLASLDDEKIRFVVVDPQEIYADYAPAVSAEPNNAAPAALNALAIVKISSDWKKTTINLRAPIFINETTRKGAQCVLTESHYGLAETLPQN